MKYVEEIKVEEINDYISFIILFKKRKNFLILLKRNDHNYVYARKGKKWENTYINDTYKKLELFEIVFNDTYKNALMNSKYSSPKPFDKVTSNLINKLKEDLEVLFT